MWIKPLICDKPQQYGTSDLPTIVCIRIHQHKENTADCNGDGGTEPLGELTQGVNHWYDQIMICG